MNEERIRRALLGAFVALFSFWFGGLFTLGAIVAPIIFRRIPAPYAADGMTEVFRRFDRIALLLAALLLLVEASRFYLRERPRGVSLFRGLGSSDALRAGALLFAAASRGAMAFFVSPEIARLHEAGAVRGSGDLGARLETFHRVAERLARVEFAFLALVLFALVVTLRAEGRRTSTEFTAGEPL